VLAAAVAGVSRLAAFDFAAGGLPGRTEQALDEFRAKRAIRI